MTTLDHLITVGYGKTNPQVEAEAGETPEPEEETPHTWEESLKPLV